MASRPVGNGNISFGLVSIPVRLFPATRSKAVSFNLLHAKDNSRIQQKIFCPVDNAIIDRSELVRGYEVVIGHARFPASCALNVSFGARLGARHPNWYGTGELYRFCELRLQ